MNGHTFVKLDHVQIAIPPGGEDQGRAFYGQVLGMDEITKPDQLRASGGVWFRAGGCEIHLGTQADFVPATKAHPGVQVSQIDALAEALESADYSVSWDERIPGRKRFFVYDPFGNRLEFLG